MTGLMMKSTKAIDQKKLCIGCGICTSFSKDVSAEMVEGVDGFLHPKIKPEYDNWNELEEICPGVQCKADFKLEKYEEKIWGPIKECFLGYAESEEIRWLGSSGGGISAFLIYLLEKQIVEAIVQIGPQKNNPLRTATYVNFTREDVLRCASSRYCPTSPLSSIKEILSGKKYKIAFVGRPCDVMALRHYLRLHPEYKNKVKFLISFFCASVPSYNATDILLQKINSNPEEVIDFWYRGKGWPGYATAVTKTEEKKILSYEKSWGDILSKHAHFRCKICPDGIGIFSDVTFADAWEIKEGKPVFDEREGRNVIMIRTAEGEEAVNGAINAGYIGKKEFAIRDLSLMQPSQLMKRKNVGARILALRFCGFQYPNCKGLPIYRNLRYSSIAQIFKNFAGALRRSLFKQK